MKETNSYQIANMLVNADGYLTIRNLVNLMFDVSFRQVEKVERNLNLDNYAWLVYSWDIEIDQAISIEDKIEITTIPTHMKRFYAYRNFSVLREGIEIARAKAIFILFDKIKLRPAIITKDIVEAYGRDNVIYNGENIKKSKVFEKSVDISIRQADLDLNGHVNNAVYFDYLKEIPGFLDQKVSYIKIVYKNEIKITDKIRLEFSEDGSFSLQSDKKNHSYGVIRYV